MQQLPRKRLFFLSGILFFLIAGLSLVYSFGYRLGESGIVRTGGLFISSAPSLDVDVFVNDEHIKKTSLLSRSTFLQSLRPGEYTVRIERENFRTWEKTVRVESELVSEIRALLVNDSPRATVLSDGDFVSIAKWNEETLLIKSRDGKARYFDVGDNVFISQITVEASSTPITLPEDRADYIDSINADGLAIDASGERILWRDGQSVWVEWLSDESLPFYTTEPISRIFKDERPIKDVQFYPRREAALVTTRNNVLVVELDGRGGHIVTPLYQGKAPQIVVPSPLKRSVYILDGGTLFEVELL